MAALQALRGYIDGITPDSEEAIVARIGAERIERVYLDGSNLGRLARAIKRAHPKTEIMTFFHNVEARFFAGALRQRPGPRPLAILIANWNAERLAARYSDRLIALNQRDSDGLTRLYGRAATDIVPMALEDGYSDGAGRATGGPDDYLLFVGGDFYANRAGILWFAEQVAPHVGLETVVVGKGMEALRPTLEGTPNMRVVGSVKTLHPYYAGARAVIAPIFDGSGMKTKVAEALMFGKHVIGTSEAFRGYEQIADRAGWVCNGKDGFVAVLNALGSPPRFDPALRAIYEENYSRAALTRRLSAIIG
jgi:glycosyltransferase involved in cell wall biosynthesis